MRLVVSFATTKGECHRNFLSSMGCNPRTASRFLSWEFGVKKTTAHQLSFGIVVCVCRKGGDLTTDRDMSIVEGDIGIRRLCTLEALSRHQDLVSSHSSTQQPAASFPRQAAA